MPSWQQNFPRHAPAYEIFTPFFEQLKFTAWPGLSQYNDLAQNARQPVLNHLGLPIAFVAQSAKSPEFENQYEPNLFKG